MLKFTMEVIAAGIATHSIFSASSWNLPSLLLLAAGVLLLAVGLRLLASQLWRVEPEEEPGAEPA